MVVTITSTFEVVIIPLNIRHKYRSRVLSEAA